MRKFATTFVLLLALLTPSLALAATWGGVETFESYTSGNNLNGGTGGSGWSAAWTNVLLNLFTVTNAQAGQGSNSVTISVTTQEPDIKRVLTTPVTGASTVLHFMMRKSINNSNNSFTYISNGTRTMVFHLNANGNAYIGSRGDSLDTLVGAYSANTWYHVYVDIDVTNSRARAYMTTGTPPFTASWTSYTSFSGTIASITEIHLAEASNGGASTQVWWDDIRDAGSDFAVANYVPNTSICVMGNCFTI